MWIPVKLVWSIQFSFFFSIGVRFFDFGAFFDLTCWFHYLMKWFLFLSSWFYGFLLIFSLVFHLFPLSVQLFARFLSVFMLSSIIINRFWSDFWCSRFFHSSSSFANEFSLWPSSRRPIQIVIYDWSTYLDSLFFPWRSIYARIFTIIEVDLRLLSDRIPSSRDIVGRFSMRNVDLQFVSSDAMLSVKTAPSCFDCYELTISFRRFEISAISFPHFPTFSRCSIKPRNAEFINLLMLQLVCFNFHYFITRMSDENCYWLLQSISNQNIVYRATFIFSRFILWRAFIEPIKAFYLMNDQARAEKRRNVTIKVFFLFRESTHVMWIKSVNIKSDLLLQRDQIAGILLKIHKKILRGSFMSNDNCDDVRLKTFSKLI
jgi:hypothetical protein